MTRRVAPMITDGERKLMLHALGLDQAKKSYRNRFSCAPFGTTAAAWEKLVDRGLAERAEGVGSDLWWYRVTDTGRDLLGVHRRRGRTMTTPHQDECEMLRMVIEAGAVEVNVLNRTQVFVRPDRKIHKKAPIIRVDFCPWCGAQINPNAAATAAWVKSEP